MSTFKVGEVVGVVTEQAKNFTRKYKYHLCVCSRSCSYLFINSKQYEGSFPLSHADFPHLPNAVSYVSCSQVFTVADDAMKRRNARLIGLVPWTVLIKLLDHIEQCESITPTERDLIVDSLADELGSR